MVEALFASLGLLLSCVIGFLFLKKVSGRQEINGLLLLFLSPGAGLTLSAGTLFICLLTFGSFPRTFLIGLHVFFLAALLFYKTTSQKDTEGPALRIWLWLFILGVAVVLFYAKALKSPFGSGEDVWAIWKLKARFLYHDPSHWRNIFSPALDFSHPDYPLYYPLLLCWGWAAAGNETNSAAILIALVFTLSTAGLLAGALLKKSKILAAVAAFFLISTPHFMGLGASQYADILVAYFFLATIVLFQKLLSAKCADLAFLTGFFAGAVCFVKNEGLLFFLIVSVFILCLRSGKTFLGFLGGSLPALLCTATFKWIAHTPSHFLSLKSWSELSGSGAFLDRIVLIFQMVLQEFVNENSWGWGWYFLIVLCLVKWKTLIKPETLRLGSILLFVNLGYFLVYLGSPIELKIHLETSLNRLLLHTYPAICYLGFKAYADSLPSHSRHGKPKVTA